MTEENKKQEVDYIGTYMIRAVPLSPKVDQRKFEAWEKKSLLGKDYAVAKILTGWVIGDKTAANKAESLLEKAVKASLETSEIPAEAMIEINVMKRNSIYTQTIGFSFAEEIPEKTSQEE